MTERAPLERPDLYVVARILDRLWREDRPILRTRLQLAARVNYDTFCRYIDWMSEKGLIAFEASESSREGIVLTEKGRDAYRRVVQWIVEVIDGKYESP